MASSSSQTPVPIVLEIMSTDSSALICIPPSPDGVAEITPQCLGIRFGYDASSIWLESDVLDPITLVVLYSMVVKPFLLENNGGMWKLAAEKYSLYGMIEFVMNASIVF